MNLSVAYLCSRDPYLGGEYYRATRPAALASREYGWTTAACRYMATDEDNEGGALSFITPGGMVICPQLIVVRPIEGWRQSWTDQAHANGQKVVADLDDDIWVHEDWELGERPNNDFYDEWFWNADAVLVSTKHLRQRIIEMGHLSPVFVAPNCYDPFGLESDPSPGRIIGTRLWLSGRMSGDLDLYDELIEPLLEELDLIFLHVGAEEGHRFLDRGWNRDRLIERSSVPIPMLPEACEGLSIGAICMSDHPYNFAKTETHAVELSSMGVPLVAASRHKLYEKVPGRVELDPKAVRNRVQDLLNPLCWEFESKAAKSWARGMGMKNETQHLDVLQKLSDVLFSH